MFYLHCTVELFPQPTRYVPTQLYTNQAVN